MSGETITADTAAVIYTCTMEPDEPYDAVPLEDVHETQGPDETGMLTYVFYAFNTVITLQAFGEPGACEAAFGKARRACRAFERRFSRTLPHSDIARLNGAKGAPVPIARDTAELVRAALRYCEESEGLFDVTVGAVVRLWDFHQGVIPDQSRIDEALAHVDWRSVRVWEEPSRNADSPQAWAQLADPEAAVDLGGIAKGWIADELTAIIAGCGVASFIVNLGGNVVAYGRKPGGAPWRIGLQDPRKPGGIVGAVDVCCASAVTSGVYERCFERDGTRYHHILDPATGRPAETDAAGVTVIARRSIDAEGYSTTLLAMGIERGIAFARSCPAIERAYFVDAAGDVHPS